MTDQEYQAQQEKNKKYFGSLSTPVTVTPQEVADRFHEDMYGKGEIHSMAHSCPCYKLALYYLKVTDSKGMYWPDGKGGNKWDRKELPKESILEKFINIRLGD